MNKLDLIIALKKKTDLTKPEMESTEIGRQIIFV